MKYVQFTSGENCTCSEVAIMLQRNTPDVITKLPDCTINCSTKEIKVNFGTNDFAMLREGDYVVDYTPDAPVADLAVYSRRDFEYLFGDK